MDSGGGDGVVLGVVIRRRHAIVLLACLFAAIWGIGYHSGRGKEESLPELPASAARGTPQREKPDRSGVDRLKDLLSAPESSQRVQMESWKIVRAMTRDEVLIALANTRADPDAGSATMQAATLYFRWAQLDPEAAMASAREHPDESSRRSMVQSALTAWMASDPETAFRHAEASPELLENLQHRTMMARLLAGEGMASALERAGRLGGDMRQRTIGALTSTVGGSESQRQDFLAGLARWGSPEEQAEGRRLVLRQLSINDPRSALGMLSGDPGDASARADVFRTWVRDDPAAALAWSATNPGTVSPADQAASYVRLLTRSSSLSRLAGKAESSIPLMEQVPGLLEASVKQLHSDCLNEGWNPYGQDSNQLARERAELRRHFTRWSEVSPDDARAWRESLPPDLQANLDATAADEDR